MKISAFFPLIFLAVVIAIALIVKNEVDRVKVHVHLPMEYKMIGRAYTDTLCIWPDTSLVNAGEHRPVPEVLQDVAFQAAKQKQIIIEN